MTETGTLGRTKPSVEMTDLESKEIENSPEIMTAEVDDENDISNEPNAEEIIEPKIGMVLDTTQDLFEFYKMYAKIMGFEIIKRTSSKGDDGELKYVTFSCSRSGKVKSLSNHPFKLQPTSKTNCKAKVRATACLDRKWEVRSITYEHNHELNTPNEDARLKNLFWADARSRAANKEFGDVITFDSTYLTNKYDMPFAAFVGVNHHGQSTLLGCGLISNEDIDTYVWLFRSWLTCMSSCAPNAIITDQDKAMQKAIEVVFPHARHRWCLWHIMKKLPEKLKGYKKYEVIKLTMQNIVYDSLIPSDFDDRWMVFIEKYNLHNNEWLQNLYDERQHWVPAYVKDIFWAGMSTTQRSESMHAFFDGYVNSKTTLKQFVEQYGNALRDKVEKENHADFNDLNSNIPCVTHYAMEHQFRDTYTMEKFREFQQELKGKIFCEIFSCQTNILTSKFVVVEDVKIGENHRCDPFEVSFNEVNCEINSELATNNENNCNMVLEVLDDLKAKLMLNGGGGEISQRGSNIAHGTTKYGEVHGSHNGKILSPLAVRSKGRPPYKRRQSKVEQITKRKKQKKTSKGSQMISSETQRYGLENNTTHAMVTSDNPMQGTA
ncbi:protein FAR1-RELATED SEQUENCE [Citrus sinensis]|uniref:Protein FAR1-RELATED SEQUENCE n=2 Tax=Citrus sinensis TaxID=2711 RepID=A0ACB8KAS6_CITSI|nr:protein FAR1-RELATED SEQUENCE [Citrus sinensis]